LDKGRKMPKHIMAFEPLCCGQIIRVDVQPYNTQKSVFDSEGRKWWQVKREKRKRRRKREEKKKKKKK
jgi:hypothetical protein